MAAPFRLCGARALLGSLAAFFGALALCDGSALSDLTATRVSYAGDAQIVCHDGTDATCTPALRLTLAEAGQAGAVWWRVPVDPAVPWEARFTVRMSRGGSTACPELDGAQSLCLQRGGHGMAFVLQDQAVAPLLVVGDGGPALGYGGLTGAVAVELDTWFDPPQEDLYNNHVAAMASGPTAQLDGGHAQALAASADLADLASGANRTFRVVYSPLLDPDLLHPVRCAAIGACDAVQTSEQLGRLLRQDPLGTGMGSLSVHADGSASPLFVAPVQLTFAVPLLSGRAGLTAGFTAATGDRQWQSHDVERWEMCVSGVCQPVFVPP